jgi:hypothetical protein
MCSYPVGADLPEIGEENVERWLVGSVVETSSSLAVEVMTMDLDLIGRLVRLNPNRSRRLKCFRFITVSR